MDYVSAYLERQVGEYMTLVNLLSIAQVVSSEVNIKIDRLAKRNRSALLCWYAENWDKISPVLSMMRTKLHSIVSNTRKDMKNQMRDYQYNSSSSDDYFDPSDINTLLNVH